MSGGEYLPCEFVGQRDVVASACLAKVPALVGLPETRKVSLGGMISKGQCCNLWETFHEHVCGEGNCQDQCCKKQDFG